MSYIKPILPSSYSSFSFARRLQEQIFYFHEFNDDDLFLEFNYSSNLVLLCTFSTNDQESLVIFQDKEFPSLFFKTFIYGQSLHWMEFVHENHNRLTNYLQDIETTDVIKSVFLYLYSLGYIDIKPSFLDKKLFFNLPYKSLASYSDDYSLVSNLLRLDELSSNIIYREDRNIRNCSYILFMIKGCNDIKYEVLVYLLYDNNYRVLDDLCRMIITNPLTGEILCFISLNINNGTCVDTLLVNSLYDNLRYRITDIATTSLFYVIQDGGNEDVVLLEEPKISNYNSFVYTRVMKSQKEYGYILSFIEENESNYYFFALTEKDHVNKTYFDELLNDIATLEKHLFMKYNFNNGAISIFPFQNEWIESKQDFIVSYLIGRIHVEKSNRHFNKFIDLEEHLPVSINTPC
ncbi:hypothetical protein K4L44_00320 [Halosquirtibacter laminarini]|uniref:Uncharacterized protein n=1 Tax=Halosquirtibacter laminarini TaxID=3374600 RepID=A0AC61NFI3_9BACT|nr:hypothetical protein K4L44_00320 [Prolixibacteraceae bacterium]